MSKENNALDTAVLLAAADNENAQLDEPLQGEQTAEPEKPTAAELLKDPEIQAYITLQIKQGIQDALRGEVPKANATDAAKIQQADFDRMTYKQRLKLFQENPHQYNKLTKGSM